MKGQWVGRFEGTNKGIAILDLDDEGTFYRGHAFAFDENPQLPSIVAEIITSDKQATQEIEVTNLAAIRPKTTYLISREQLAQETPGIVFPTKLTIRLQTTTDGLAANGPPILERQALQISRLAGAS